MHTAVRAEGKAVVAAGGDLALRTGALESAHDGWHAAARPGPVTERTQQASTPCEHSARCGKRDAVHLAAGDLHEVVRARDWTRYENLPLGLAAAKHAVLAAPPRGQHHVVPGGGV